MQDGDIVSDGAKPAKRNGDPSPGSPTEETESELEEFIDYAKIVMGALGHKVLEPLVSSTESDDEEPTLYMTYGSANAKGKRTSDGFVVLKGSVICINTVASCPESAINDRKKYAEHIDENGTINADLLFSSPSGAAAFVGGASLNGNKLWKDQNGKTLKELDNM